MESLSEYVTNDEMIYILIKTFTTSLSLSEKTETLKAAILKVLTMPGDKIIVMGKLKKEDTS